MTEASSPTPQPLSDSMLREQLEELFLKHQRPGIGVCTCGGMRLGESYPQHLADAVLAAHLGQQQAAIQRVRELLPRIEDLAQFEEGGERFDAASSVRTVHKHLRAALGDAQ
jgi:hypothetical protein